MRSNRGSGTKPELALSRLLRKKIMKTGLPGSPDFVYPRSKLAVFVHGCFWHRCPIHAKSLPKVHTAFWRRKFERNKERDRLNREELRSLGWRVIEIWEHEIREDPQSVAAKIRRFARQAEPLPVRVSVVNQQFG
ncbi:MAG: very short patch repair endonuclease [Nitrososphaerota archaeon]|nr:very short patch repair endonuclease [Nitrososphaerota archaeon]